MSREMKDSGIPWIGEIPSHWRFYRIRHNTFLKGRIGWQGLNSNDFIDEGYCLITGTDFDNKGGIHWETCYRISKERFDEDELLHVKEGDLLMTKDGTVGKMAYIKYLPEEASLNSHLLIIRQLSNIISNSFLYWVMLSDVFKGFIAHYQTGTIMSSISQNTLGYFSCFCPPPPEQIAIAVFLDKKCSEIDDMISLQEEIIEELKAYKQSVITEAVCKGLNPNTPQRDSGIEGVNVPSHWDTRKFNQLCSRITDFVASGSFASLRENVPYLDTPDYAMLVRTADLSNTAKSEGRVYISQKSYDFLRNSNLFGGEIVLPNIGSIGDVYIVPKDLYPKMSLAPNAITFSTLQNDKYYYYYFLGALGKKQLHDIAESTAMPKFNKTDLKQLRVLCPPIEEQQTIADFLDVKCAEIDTLISLKQSKIDALKEYKKSIIYEYITGKKEVPYGEQ